MAYYQHPRYNGRVGVYRTNQIEQFERGNLGWTGSVIHFDSMLSTLPYDAYGYNTLSGGNITRLSNLSDVTMSTDATGSGLLSGSGASTNIYINIPSTPLFTTGRGFTSPVTYNISSTQSTYFMVSTSYFSEISNFNSIIRSNGNTQSAQSISDNVGGLMFQANKATDDIVGTHIFTKSLSVNYLTTLRGTTTETSNGTVVKSNGSTHSFSSGFTLGGNYTQTSLFEYYITSSPDTRGRTMSFSELIYFDYRLSDSEFNAVESYLKNKWSISY
jgi:hypothetical protein